MSTLQDTVTGWAFTVGWKAVRYLPEGAAEAAFRAAADRTWRRRGRSVRRLEANLRRVLPGIGDDELRALSREGLRRYMRYYCEAFRLPSWPVERIQQGVVLDGVEHLDAAVRAGRGAVVVGSHSGNWDLAGGWGALRYGGVMTVVERLKPEAVFEQFLAFRTSLGVEALALGETGIVGRLTRAARDGRVVALVGDRDLSGHGIDVDFLGAPAPFPTGPAAVSLLSGAPLFVISTWYDGDLLRGECVPVPTPAEGSRDERIQDMTQRVADILARIITEHPADWHMLQRLWPDDPEAVT